MRGRAAAFLELDAKGFLVTVRILSVALLALLVVALAACGSNGGGGEEANTPASSSESSATRASAPSAPAGVVRVTNRDAGGSGEYRFDPPELRFEVGQEVTFLLSGETEFHTLHGRGAGYRRISRHRGDCRVHLYVRQGGDFQAVLHTARGSGDDRGDRCGVRCL